MERYGWQEIGMVPSVPGVYAWYFVPQLTRYDLERIIVQVREHMSRSDKGAAKALLHGFLEEIVFKPYQEQPFDVALTGQLLPHYRGQVEHRPSLSDSLLERLIQDPERLWTIREVLSSSAPWMASPIYIGMSNKLGARLRKHKRLIETYGDRHPEALSDEDLRDQCFAREVCVRNMPRTQLFVMAREIKGAEGSYVDAENILNRIHFPLLGRN